MALRILVLTTLITQFMVGCSTFAAKRRDRSAPADCNYAMSRAPMDQVKIAAIQFPVVYNLTEDQLIGKVQAYILEAVHHDAKLIVFPELISLDLLQNPSAESDENQLRRVAENFSPRYFSEIRRLAMQHGVSILAGTSPTVENGQVMNTAYLVFSNGQEFKQNKIFMTPDEVGWHWQGGRELNIIAAPWGKTVILTCFDCEFPQISNLLAPHQPELILVPSMTGDRSGLNRVRWSAQAHAVAHYAHVVQTGVVGRPDYHGQATFITPQEPGFPTEVVVGPDNSSAIVYSTLDLRQLRERRQTAGVWPAREQIHRQAKPELRVNEPNSK